jgi:hypothetical protein
LGGSSHSKPYVASMENSFPFGASQITATNPGSKGRQATWRCTWSHSRNRSGTCEGWGNTQQPGTSGYKWHSNLATAHSANLALTITNESLTATNKKLVDAATKKGTTPTTMPAKGGGKNAPHPGNYCWTHRHWISKGHLSATCSNKAVGHKYNATAENKMGGSEKDTGWERAWQGGLANLVYYREANCLRNNDYYSLATAWLLFTGFKK